MKNVLGVNMDSVPKADEKAKRYCESQGLADGMLVDATARYPEVCKKARLLHRAVFTAPCWFACVASPGAASVPGPAQEANLVRVLELFKLATVWTPPGQPLKFAAEVEFGDGAKLEMEIKASVGNWDRDPGQKYILFWMGFEC